LIQHYGKGVEGFEFDGRNHPLRSDLEQISEEVEEISTERWIDAAGAEIS